MFYFSLALPVLSYSGLFYHLSSLIRCICILLKVDLGGWGCGEDVGEGKLIRMYHIKIFFKGKHYKVVKENSWEDQPEWEDVRG